MSLLIRSTLILSLCFSSALFAFEGDSPFFSINGAFGVGNYAKATKQEDQAIGRLSLSSLLKKGNLAFGIEGGLQTGNTIRFDFPEEDIFVLGGVPIEVQIKPLLDILLITRIDIPNKPLFGMLKGGIAYRQMQADRQSVNNVTDVAAEIQAVVGLMISKNASINLSYQYIFGTDPTLKVDPSTESGILSHIPEQQALMLGFSYNF